jgi:hypothetical protein
MDETNERLEKNTANHASRRLANSAGALDTKELGDLGELAFVLAASAKGLAVSKPYGDCRRYDLIVDSGRRMVRVQVKSVHKSRSNCDYQVTCCSRSNRFGQGSVIYTKREIDFVAVYLAALDIWYLIPIVALGTITVIHLHPHGLKKKKLQKGWARFEIYKEAWEQLSEHVKKR